MQETSWALRPETTRSASLTSRLRRAAPLALALLWTVPARLAADTAPPTNPTVLQSTSHSESVWSNDATVDVEWSGASDADSGLAGYSVAFDTSDPGDPPTFLSLLGSPGSGDGQFSIPFSAAVDSSGNVYVADFGNHRIQKFDSSGTFLLKWGSSGPGNGEFAVPQGVAVDASGNVYVADTDNHRIQKFSPSGVYLLQWGSNGSGDGQFAFPAGVAGGGCVQQRLRGGPCCPPRPEVRPLGRLPCQVGQPGLRRRTVQPAFRPGGG